MIKSSLIYLSLFELFVCLLSAAICSKTMERQFFEISMFSFLTFFIYVSTTWIALFPTSKQNDFVLRILLLITLQMLFFFSVALAIIYTRDDLSLVLYFLGLFLTLLVVQTIALVKFR